MLSRLQGLPRSILIGAVRAYRLLLSPSLGSSCRFEPTCSAYALQALERHGAVAGTGLIAYRLARCHPWCTPGFDPVPDRPRRPFSRLLDGAAAHREASLSTSSDKNCP